MKQQVLGKLIGNTGDPNNLSMSLNSPFAGRRGEFVRIRHQERKEEPETDVLGRIVSVSRSNLLFNSGMGDSVNDLELMPGAKISGDSLFARIELIGYKDPASGQIKIPRRPTRKETATFGKGRVTLPMPKHSRPGIPQTRRATCSASRRRRT